MLSATVTFWEVSIDLRKKNDSFFFLKKKKKGAYLLLLNLLIHLWQPSQICQNGAHPLVRFYEATEDHCDQIWLSKMLVCLFLEEENSEELSKIPQSTKLHKIITFTTSSLRIVLKIGLVKKFES